MSTTVANKQLSLMDLYKVGSHRGNKKSKLNPKLKSNVYGSKAGLTLIDLGKLLETLQATEQFVYNLGKKRKQILIVGTKPHLQDLTRELAGKMTEAGMPFVNQRWLGGTMTNWTTVRKTLKKLTKNEKIMNDEEVFNSLSRNEKLLLEREQAKLEKIFGGLRNLRSSKPGAVLVLDGQNNAVAIKEADVVNVPVITLMNTGSKTIPTNTDFTVVCNNNSFNLVELLTDRLVEAYQQGLTDGAAEELKADKEPKKARDSRPAPRQQRR